MVNLFIANTDNTWFDFLAAEQNINEVNFWWPGETTFRAIQPGELLVFRLKSPRNKIVVLASLAIIRLYPSKLPGTALAVQTAYRHLRNYEARSQNIELILSVR